MISYILINFAYNAIDARKELLLHYINVIIQCGRIAKLNQQGRIVFWGRYAYTCHFSYK